MARLLTTGNQNEEIPYYCLFGWGKSPEFGISVTVIKDDVRVNQRETFSGNNVLWKFAQNETGSQRSSLVTQPQLRGDISLVFPAIVVPEKVDFRWDRTKTKKRKKNISWEGDGLRCIQLYIAMQPLTTDIQGPVRDIYNL